MAVNLQDIQSRPVQRVSTAPSTLAHVDLSRPGAADNLQKVCNDWLFGACSPEGQRKLLSEHDLLAA